MAIGAAILLFSCLDGLLTLSLLGRGAYEANPVMAAVLASGSVAKFATVKLGLTTAGVVVLTSLARLIVFGCVRVSTILCGTLALYVALVIYELGLLGVLGQPR